MDLLAVSYGQEEIRRAAMGISRSRIDTHEQVMPLYKLEIDWVGF